MEVQAARDTLEAENRIYARIFAGIMDRRLTPGTKLPERELCELFAASRSLVRRVLQRLAHDHVVELRPNRGAIVATPTPEETRQIFEARRAIEAALVRLAAQEATAADIVDLRRQLLAEQKAMHGADQSAWARVASAFHLRVAGLAHNGILEKYLQEIVSRCSLIVALYEPRGHAACEHDEHAGIVSCLEQGDGDGAARLMERHLVQLERRICLRQWDVQPTLRERLGL